MNPNETIVKRETVKREFKPRFAIARCMQCSWHGHGAKYTTGSFLCSYCDPPGSSTAAGMQKDWWLKTGWLR